MHAVAWLLSIVLLLANVAAVVWLVMGGRSSVSEELAHLHRRAKWGLAIAAPCSIVLVLLGGLAIVSIFGAVDGTHVEPAQRTRIMMEGIAQAVGWMIAAVFLSILPALTVGVLGRRRERLPA